MRMLLVFTVCALALSAPAFAVEESGSEFTGGFEAMDVSGFSDPADDTDMVAEGLNTIKPAAGEQGPSDEIQSDKPTKAERTKTLLQMMRKQQP